MPLYNREERFRILSDFWGWGNPRYTQTLFIGNGEGGDVWGELQGDLDAIDRKLELRDTKYIPREDMGLLDPHWATKLTRTENIQILLAMKFRGLVCDTRQQRLNYNRDHAHQYEFTANYEPVARPKMSAEFSDKLLEILGIPGDYEHCIHQSRAEALR